MAWIESHQELREHPKVYHLSELLKVSKAAALGHLHLLWWWCVDYCPSGKLKANDGLVARAGEWAGDAKEFVSALIEAGWLDRGNSVLTIHDWDEYFGKLNEMRASNRLRQKQFRERKRDVTVTSPLYNGLPNSTQPNSTQPKAINRLSVKRASAEDDEGENAFMAFILGLLGKVEMAEHGGLWRTLFRQNGDKAWRVMRELRATLKDRPTEIATTPAQFAMDLWKRFV